MKKRERIERIIELCKINEQITVGELVHELNASEATIRRDLHEMEEDGVISRYHGGAKISNTFRMEPTMNLKTGTNSLSKRQVGLLAARLIKDNQMIFIDAGSTTYEMIDFIKAKNITVVTNGIPHLNKLGKRNINTIILGGNIRWNTAAVIGNSALKQLDEYYFDIMFLGVNGIHEHIGLTTSNDPEDNMKSKALSRSQNVYVLADSSKFNLLMPVKFANLEDVVILADEIPGFDRTKLKYMLINGETNISS